jgi:hypothetical protein
MPLQESGGVPIVASVDLCVLAVNGCQVRTDERGGGNVGTA